MQLIIQSFRDQPTTDFLELPLETIFSALYPTRHYTVSDPAGRRAFGRLVNTVQDNLSPYVVLIRMSHRRKWQGLFVKILSPQHRLGQEETSLTSELERRGKG